MPDRKKLYQEIINVAKEGLARYYSEFPELIDDQRAAEASAWSLRGIGRIIKILDQYEIRERPKLRDETATKVPDS